MSATLNVGNGDWATKENSLLGYNSENGNYKPLPFDFTRASNGTFVNKSGLIETAASGVPRIDFLNDSKGALLLEPSRSNLIIYSEDVISWNTTNSITRSNNADISPDGTLSACTIIGTNNATFNSILQTFSVSANSTNTFSMFIKKVETETNYLGVGMVYTGGTTDVAYVSFDSVNGIARSMDARIVAETNVIDFGDYWRLEVTSTDDQSNTNLRLDVYATLSTDGFNVSVGASSLRTIWGMQLELNSSYATSLINTQGSAVTRVADVCTNGGNDQVFNSEEGTLYFEGNVLDNDLTYRQISLSETPSGNDVLTLDYSSSSNGIRTYFRVNGTAYSLTYVLTDSTQKVKIAVRYTDTLSLWVNGVQVASTPTPAVSTNFDNLSFDNGSGGGNFYGKTKDVRVYNTALTDAELQALTS